MKNILNKVLTSKIFTSVRVSTLISFCIIFIYIVSSIIVVLLVNHYIKKQALIEAESKAHILLDHNLSIHHYFSHQLKPAVFNLTNTYRDKEYFDPIWMSSTFAVREIHKKFQKKTSFEKYYYKECAINARDIKNEADDIEKAFIKELNSNPSLVTASEIRYLDGKPYFVVLRRGEVMEESCTLCHSTPERAPVGLINIYGSKRSFNRKVGEVISAISIRIPLSKAFENANKISIQLSISLLTIMIGMFYVGQWVSKRLLFMPIVNIKDKALKISNDITYLGEKIPLPLGLELKNLTIAFNDLSISLKEKTEELEKLNFNLEKRVIEEVDRNRQKDLLIFEQIKQMSMTELLINIAHNWRQPLNGIAAILQDIEDEYDYGGLSKEYLQNQVKTIMDELSRLSHIISSFKDVYCPKETAKQGFNLSMSIRKSIYLLDGQIKRDNISVITEIVDDVIVKGNVESMSRAIIKIITNSMDIFKKRKIDNRKIKISLKKNESGTKALLCISDNGGGVGKEIINRIFDPYFTTNYRSREKGLGLYMVKTIIEKEMEGTLLVKNDDVGAVFIMEILI